MSADTQVLESLAFLYLAFGHSTDGNMAPEEMRTLAGKLKEWAPNHELSELGELLKGAVASYKGAGGGKMAKAREIMNGLRGQLDDSQMSKVLADLEAIAEADGIVSEEERVFIDETRAALRG